MLGRTSRAFFYILSLKPERMVSGQKWKTEDISPAIQNLNFIIIRSYNEKSRY